MAVKQIIKRLKTVDIVHTYEEVKAEPVISAVPAKKNKEKKNSDIMTPEEIMNAEALAKQLAPEVKVVKKDRGLIERTESSKIVLTEDNRQVLSD